MRKSWSNCLTIPGIRPGEGKETAHGQMHQLWRRRTGHLTRDQIMPDLLRKIPFYGRTSLRGPGFRLQLRRRGNGRSPARIKATPSIGAVRGFLPASSLTSPSRSRCRGQLKADPPRISMRPRSSCFQACKHARSVSAPWQQFADPLNTRADQRVRKAGFEEPFRVFLADGVEYRRMLLKLSSRRHKHRLHRQLL